MLDGAAAYGRRPGTPTVQSRVACCATPPFKQTVKIRTFIVEISCKRNILKVILFIDNLLFSESAVKMQLSTVTLNFLVLLCDVFQAVECIYVLSSAVCMI